jgi:hypothetical protein
MTDTRTIGGGVRDPGLNPIEDAEISLEINAPVMRVTDESSISKVYEVHTDAAGTWALEVPCNDFLTPMGTSYKIHEKYPTGDYKLYYVRVLSTLPGGINQVLDLLTNNPPALGGEMAVIADGVNGSILATVKALTNSKPLMVAIADANGDQITSFGGGTQYTEDAVAAADPIGTAPILVRKDTPAATVSADGDNIAQRGTNFGAAYTSILTSTGTPVDTFGGGTQYTEDAVAAADPVGNALIGVRKDALVSEVSADGDNIAARMTGKGEQYVKHVDIVSVAGGDLSILSGAIRGEDSPSADAHSGIGVLAIRKATPADTSGADGDYEFLQMKSGRLWASATVDAALPAGNNNIGDVDVATLPASTNTLEVVGDVAEDAALAGNPVRAGVRASTAVPTAMSADGDVVTPWADRSGALIVIPQPRSARIKATPTIATSGYVAGDRVGSVMTFTAAALATARSTQIVQASLTSRTATAKNDLNLWLFETNPTIASADNAALDITGANIEAANLIGVVQFLATDYYDTANSCACNASLNKGPVTLFANPTAGADIFGVLEAGATVAAQYAGTTDIIITLWTNPC